MSVHAARTSICRMRVFGALLAVGALTGIASASTDTPPSLARYVIVQWTTGSPERAWASLHPAQQRIVSRRHFAYCVRAGRGERLYPTRVTVAGSSKVRINRAEIPQRSGWSVRLVVTRTAAGRKTRDNWTLEVVQVRQRYR